MKFRNKKTGEIKEFEPLLLDAALVSAQRRRRLFWTNIPNITLPQDRGILLKDILEEKVSSEDFHIKGSYKTWLESESGQKRIKKGFIKINPGKAKGLMARDYANWSGNMVRVGQIGKGDQGDRIYSIEGKSVNLSANGGGRGTKTGLYHIPHGYIKEKITEEEKYPTLHSQSPRANHLLMIKDFVRKLTPIECERLTTLPEVKKSCIIRVWKENQNIIENGISPISIESEINVNVEKENGKKANVVGNVEKKELKNDVQSAKLNLNLKNHLIKKPVQPCVLISCRENTCQIKSRLNVNYVEKQNLFFPREEMDDLVRLIVGLNTIVEKIMLSGEAELLPKNNLLVAKENGSNVVNIFGKGITQLAENAEKDLTTLNKLLKSTTSDPFGQENKEQLIQTLFSYVVLAIIIYIPKEIQNQNILTFQIKHNFGYTKYGINEKGEEILISNTQRYKMCGNAFLPEVVKHILSFLFV